MEFRLDENARKRLVGLMPFSQNGTMDFTPAEYEKRGIPAEAIPVFQLRAWTKAEAGAVRSRIEKKTTEDTSIISEARIATKGWQRLYDLAASEPITFKASPEGGADTAVFETLPYVIVIALWRQVARLSGLIEPAAMLTEEETQGLGS